MPEPITGGSVHGKPIPEVLSEHVEWLQAERVRQTKRIADLETDWQDLYTAAVFGLQRIHSDICGSKCCPECVALQENIEAEDWMVS